MDKENIAEGLLVESLDASALKSPAKTKAVAAPSPKKPNKSRSKSIGPGGLDALKEDAGNRRKSAIVPTVKSILTSKEDEVKRREARRKSLANRRVSFAPEATLHTWDVIEYMRDATTSSASSESTRRASLASQASNLRSPNSKEQSPAPGSDPAEPPSTPPEQIEEPEPLPGSSPANQRDLHQRKRRRRSSGIPPMNFNNPEDALSSSPYSGSSVLGSDEIEGSSDDDGGSTVMSLDIGDGIEQSLASLESNDSTGSSARLDAALRQAAAQAGTRGIDFDENGDLSMEIATDETTAAFKPWAQKAASPHALQNLSSLQDQENINPFSPAFKAQVISTVAVNHDKQTLEVEAEDLSMDITKAVGGILPARQSDSPDEDATMDLTMAIGGIRDPAADNQPTRNGILKRRRSSTLHDPFVTTGNAQGSPAKRQATRRNSVRRRRSSTEESSLGDETMDFTAAIGEIQVSEALRQDDRRSSIDTSFGEEGMDLTMAVGSIKNGMFSETHDGSTVAVVGESEDLSMDFTAVLGTIKENEPRAATPKVTPVKEPASTQKKDSTTPLKTSTTSNDVRTPTATKPSPQKAAVDKRTPQKSPRKSPRKSLAPRTPEEQDGQDELSMIAIEDPSPAVGKGRRNSARKSETVTTPKGEAHVRKTTDNLTPIPASSVATERKEASPARNTSQATPQKQAPVKSALALSDSIKLLSTPRKQPASSLTPKKLPTPKKEPTPKKFSTPKRATTPKKHVHVSGDAVKPDSPQHPPVNKHVEMVVEKPAEEEVQHERIQLQDFLTMTNIRFMDLTTTKRRATGFTGAVMNGEGDNEDDDAEKQDPAPTLESSVVAAACTLPMFELYQHSCHELKKDISAGRDRAREIEEDVYESNPPLFRDYMSAPSEERYIMDNQFKNMKTNARLQSKATWHGWRSQLLNDLLNILTKTRSDFDRDDAMLKEQEELIAAALPSLTARHEELESECARLQERADELNGSDREELDAVRDRLIAADSEIEEKKALVEALQRELEEKEATIEAVKERKVECVEEIKSAERVREECRGWSASEVNALKARVDDLESQYGWSILSASSDPNTLTLSYRNDLQLFFHPSSFLPSTSSGPTPSAQTTPNAPISLTYIGESPNLPRPKPLTTTKRFFLQLLRAHLQCLPQSQTHLPALLHQISAAWTAALAVAEGVRTLDLAFMTEEAILSDERMAVKANVLLPGLQTKVRACFEVGVCLAGGAGIEVGVKTNVGVVYGERYDEAKMGEFLGQYIGGRLRDVEEMTVWADGVRELRTRLIRRGRKG